MITIEQARDAIVAGVSRAVDTETVPLGLAHGRFLADEVRAFVASPSFDNAAMDGYAVRVADLQGNHVKLPITSESRCGDAPPTLASQSAMRIFTGAPMPAGADAVVIQEDVERQGSQAIFRSDVRAGENIRRQGEDFGAGEVLYRRGRRLSACDIVLMGTAGIAEVTVFRRARALVIATGDELVSPGAER
ncbi:MAG: molybdopterin molybdotransferase MoeA, partial [Acidiferrobacterales bacterium]